MRDIDDVIADFERATSLPALGDIFQRTIADFGFASYEFVEISDLSPRTPFHIGTSGRWRDIYVANGFRFVDPSLARARAVGTPFNWSSIPPPKTRSRQVNRIIEAAADIGLTDSFFCPHHMRDAEDRLRSHACALLWSDKADAFRRRIAEHRHALHLITTHFMERAATLRGLRAQAASPVDHRFIELTTRERQILEHAAHGRTGLEVAEILDISALTVQTHMKNAIRKTGASNKTHAVALAIARGLVRL